ncbi:uncharacterized protein LOC107728771 [Sinocyclocheilus rhinocerous]|uniref:uncharacterized protein LOC107728771 n=1 Tax=Sinocyclocheilus rhinocerous TaxID=307959 RepID=UPI0007B8C14C|nr:PREDICTED: uncharacterized protein LOC107728771 [Sinocyclocheilus rhinocerous]
MEEHSYSMDTDEVSGKRERGTDSNPSTPFKSQSGKKAKKSIGNDLTGDMSNIAILDAIKALGVKVDEQHEDISMQLKQHSAMIASMAKAVQINAEEVKECKEKVSMLEKQLETLTKENDNLRNRVLDQERYKRRWCLCIRGMKEILNENIREDVIQLLVKITPEFSSNMYDAVDVVHRVGKKEATRPREVIILFARRGIRDEIWKRTKDVQGCWNQIR